MPGDSHPTSREESFAHNNERHEWKLSKDAAVQALPALLHASRPFKSGNAWVETPQMRQARNELEQLYKAFPDLRSPEADAL
jgi:hypothetical protein